MSDMIPLSVPSIQGNEWKYVKECLDTEWVSSVGPFVERFEKEICDFSGSAFSIACVNGTAGLQVALRIAGVEPVDEVIAPTVTFIAPINAVRYLGADSVFMDCDQYYNIDAEKTIQFIKNETSFIYGYSFNRRTKKKISALIVVHVFGNLCYLDELLPICQERNIKVIEDATESLGSFYSKGNYSNKHAGTIGEIGVYSFNGNKIITTGGGGMIVTQNKRYAQQAKYLTTQAKDDHIRFIHNEVGYNFRLTNLQAAVGVAQLEKLSDFIKIKKSNYQIYKKHIQNIEGLCLASTPNYADCNHWLYCLQIDKIKYGKDREQLMLHLKENKIETRPIWHLNHLQKPYRHCQSYQIERAFGMLEKTLNIPCSVNLKKAQIDVILKALQNC